MTSKVDTSRFRKILRWILWFFLGLSVFVGLVVLALPFWLGAALSRSLPEGTSYERFERNGMTSFVIHGLDSGFGESTLKVDRAEALYPMTWLWRALSDKTEEPFVHVGSVSLDLKLGESETEEAKSGELPSLVSILKEVESTLVLVDKWAPHAQVDHVKLVSGEQTLLADTILWKERQLSTRVEVLSVEGSATELKAIVSDYPWTLKVGNQAKGILLDAAIERVEDVATVSGAVEYLDNNLTFSSSFGPQDLVPHTANWTARSWEVDKRDFNIEKSAYDTLSFDLEGSWNGELYENDIVGKLSASELADQWPSIDFEADVKGDEKQASLDNLRLNGPGLNVRLNEPAHYEFASKKLLGDLFWALDVDLSQLNRVDVSGTIVGDARFISEDGKDPSGSFSFSGEDLKWKEYEVQTADISGALQWPFLVIDEGIVNWTESVFVQLEGRVDLEKNEIVESNLAFDLNSTALADYIPTDTEFDQLKGNIALSGDAVSPQYSGVVEFDGLRQTPLKPMRGTIEFDGEMTDVERLALSISAEENSMSLVGSGSLLDGVATLNLSELSIHTEGVGDMRLVEPLDFNANLGGETIQLDLKSLTMISESGSISATANGEWPKSLQAGIQINELQLDDWVNPWLLDGEEIPKVRVGAIDTQVAWSDGPAKVDADLDVELAMDEHSYRVHGKVNTDRTKLKIEDIELSIDGEAVATFSGTTEATYDASRSPSLSLDPDTSFEFVGASQDSELLTALISSYLPFDVDSVTFSLDLGGEIGNPNGQFSVLLNIPKEEGDYGLPEAQIEFEAHVEGENIAIEQVTLSTEDSRFDGSGELVLPESAFQNLVIGEEVTWGETRYRVTLPLSELTPISRFIPHLIAPGGTVEADISGVGSESIHGFCRIENVNTRTLFPFGALRDINTQLDFDKSVVRLSSFEGKIGREAIFIEGEYDLDDNSFGFSVDAKNVALLRQSGLLLRSDLDIDLKQEAGKAAKVTGLVNLREGLFMMDTSSLIGGSGGGRSVESRPPYFSVEVPPLSDWELSLSIVGDKFMRLQTPAATGVLSMDMELKGKLSEPWLEGDVSFDEGDLVFPFAAFEITEGIIDFPISDPYTPTILMLGETKRFGYDLSVDISGEAFDPQIRFTSSPALSSEQILMMVMAGENPDGVDSYGNSKKASKIGSYLAKGLFSSGKESSGIGSRLSIDSGENLSRQGKETLDVEFMIADRVQLVGEYDEYDAWNAGIRFNVLKQTMKSPVEKKPSEQSKVSNEAVEIEEMEESK